MRFYLDHSYGCSAASVTAAITTTMTSTIAAAWKKIIVSINFLHKWWIRILMNGYLFKTIENSLSCFFSCLHLSIIYGDLFQFLLFFMRFISTKSIHSFKSIWLIFEHWLSIISLAWTEEKSLKYDENSLIFAWIAIIQEEKKPNQSQSEKKLRFFWSFKTIENDICERQWIRSSSNYFLPCIEIEIS